MKYTTASPYIASYAIVRKADKLAFVLRSNTDWMNDYYGLPSGKVEQGESFSSAVIREAQEEIGITVAKSDLRQVLTMHRAADSDEKDSNMWVDVFFEVAQWQGEPYNAEPDKHSRMEWLDPNNLPENVIPCVRAALQAIAAGKNYTEFGWGEANSFSN